MKKLRLDRPDGRIESFEPLPGQEARADRQLAKARRLLSALLRTQIAGAAGLCISVLLLATACQDPTQPNNPGIGPREEFEASASAEPVEIDPATAAILASAWEYAGDFDESPLVVGVLDRQRTDQSVVVAYYWANSQRAYQFTLDGATWSKRDEVSSDIWANQRRTDNEMNQYLGMGAQSLGQRILGRIYASSAAILQEFFINTQTAQAGDYSAGPWNSSGNDGVAVRFYGRDWNRDGKTFTVRQRHWQYERKDAPKCARVIISSGVTPTTCYGQNSNGNYVNAGAQKVTLAYRVNDITVSAIAGRKSIPRAGTYKWSVNVSGSKDSYKVKWYRKSAASNTWGNPVKTETTSHSSYYWRKLGCPKISFDLKVVVDDVAESGPVSVNTSRILCSGISGTNDIRDTGTYSWSSFASGGDTPYSYKWEVVDDSNPSNRMNFGTKAGMTRWVDVNFNSDFTIYLKVTSADGQIVNSGPHYVWVRSGDCDWGC